MCIYSSHAHVRTYTYMYVRTYIGRQLLISSLMHANLFVRTYSAFEYVCVRVNLYVLYIELCTWFSPQHALQCSPNTWMTTFAQFPGVLDEREYWKTRLTTLTSIREQLSSLLALTILSHLEEAHSSYSGVFGQVYKDVDKVLSSCTTLCPHVFTPCPRIHTV